MNKKVEVRQMNEEESKLMQFMDAFHQLRALIEVHKGKIDRTRFNKYMEGLPQEKAQVMEQIRKYRNDWAFHRQGTPFPAISEKQLDEWMGILEEEINHIKNQKN